jgi:hypothetical protein
VFCLKRVQLYSTFQSHTHEDIRRYAVRWSTDLPRVLVAAAGNELFDCPSMNCNTSLLFEESLTGLPVNITLQLVRKSDPINGTSLPSVQRILCCFSCMHSPGKSGGVGILSGQLVSHTRMSSCPLLDRLPISMYFSSKAEEKSDKLQGGCIDCAMGSLVPLSFYTDWFSEREKKTNICQQHMKS